MDKYQKAHHDWIECLCRIGRSQTETFEEDNMRYVDLLTAPVGGLRRSIMLWIYNDLSKNGRFERIENLDAGTKKQMWATIKEICAGKTEDKEMLIEITKIFYVIEYFLNEKK